MKRIAASLIIIMATSSAYAEGDVNVDVDSGLYVVGSFGRVGLDKNQIQVDSNNSIWNLTSPPPASIYTSSKTTGLKSVEGTSNNGFKLQLGYEFTPNFAIEGGYVHLGKATYDATYISTPYGNFFGVPVPGTGTRRNATRTLEFSGWNFAGLGIYPINKSLSAFAKFGVINAKAEYSASDVGSSTATKLKANYGFGATYTPAKLPKLGVRVEYERFVRLGDSQTSGITDVSLMSMGVTSKF